MATGTTLIDELPQKAIEAGRLAMLTHSGGDANDAMRAGVEAALLAAGFRHEWAVPCLDGGPCRTIVPTLEAARGVAARRSIDCIERRVISPFRPVE